MDSPTASSARTIATAPRRQIQCRRAPTGRASYRGAQRRRNENGTEGRNSSSAGVPLSENLQVLVQAVVALGGALLHARLEHPVTILLGVEHGGGRQRGLAIVFLERDG